MAFDVMKQQQERQKNTTILLWNSIWLNGNSNAMFYSSSKLLCTENVLLAKGSILFFKWNFYEKIIRSTWFEIESAHQAQPQFLIWIYCIEITKMKKRKCCNNNSKNPLKKTQLVRWFHCDFLWTENERARASIPPSAYEAKRRRVCKSKQIYKTALIVQIKLIRIFYMVIFCIN